MLEKIFRLICEHTRAYNRVRKMKTKEMHYEGKFGKYYTDMRNDVRRISSPLFRFDKDGILRYKIPYTNNFDYYPVFIAGYALGNFNFYLDTGKNRYIDAFMKQSDWLVSDITLKRENIGDYEHRYVFPYYDNFEILWVYGMAQGLAISVLLRAYQRTNDNIYFESAKKVYGAFETDIEGGGVRYTDEAGNVWLEEYAVLPPPHILNGFIFIFWGVHEFYNVTKNKKVLELRNKIIKTLEDNLKFYDTGYYSLYDLLRGYPTTKSYHSLHIRQLKALYRITNEQIFVTYSKRWEEYLTKSLYNRMAYLIRGGIHIKRYGVKGCIGRYFLRRKWLKGN